MKPNFISATMPNTVSTMCPNGPAVLTSDSRMRSDGRHTRLQRALGRVDLLILDDWGLEPFDAAARHDLLEILGDR